MKWPFHDTQDYFHHMLTHVILLHSFHIQEYQRKEAYQKGQGECQGVNFGRMQTGGQ